MSVLGVLENGPEAVEALNAAEAREHLSVLLLAKNIVALTRQDLAVIRTVALYLRPSANGIDAVTVLRLLIQTQHLKRGNISSDTHVLTSYCLYEGQFRIIYYKTRVKLAFWLHQPTY